MAELWDAFLEDYPEEQLLGWGLSFILELFWHYCQDGSKAVGRILKAKERKKLETVHEVKMLLKAKEAKDGP